MESEIHSALSEFHGMESENHSALSEFHGMESENHSALSEFHGMESENHSALRNSARDFSQSTAPPGGLLIPFQAVL